MASDSLLLLVWTVLAVLFGIFVLWKYLKSINVNCRSISKTGGGINVKKARLKYFASNPEAVRPVSSNNADRSEVREVNTKLENGMEQETRQEGRGCESLDSHRPRPSAKFTKLIEGPSSNGLHDFEKGHLDPDTSAPITQPLNTLDDVLSWRQGFDFFNVATVHLTDECRKLEKRPRTLVCHDMKGGYLADRFVQGVSSDDCYVIYHWQLIDTFVYFSHHFVTIPPPCWTNAAHTHGVPVLGTVITENEDGIERCSKFLEDTESWQHLANQLINIAEYYKFDGWLMNIENPIQPGQVNNLEEFIKYLTSEIHQRIPNSLVIWYDSVTYKGVLEGQNELNSNNRVFFDACDGIFVNYGWTEATLMRSRAAAGRDRIPDVYVGVDVFGRGCFGGGGYNCNKALKVIREETLSAALFAPGWVMETQGSKNFFEHEDRFWGLLAPFCTVHAVVSKIPFVTSLCRGCGKTASIDGKVVVSHPWTNLSAQQCQPSFNNSFFNLGTQKGLVVNSVKNTMDQAYNGGSCLLVSGCVNSSSEVSKSVVRLLKTDFQINGPLLLSFTFKLDPVHCLGVALQLHTDKVPTYLLLLPGTSSEEDLTDPENSELNEKLVRRYGIPKSRTSTSSAFTSPIGLDRYRMFEPLTGDSHNTVQQAHGMTVDEDVETWCTRHYLIAEKELVGHTVQEIRLVCSVVSGANFTGEFSLYLGEIKIIDPQVLKLPLGLARNVRSLDLEWKSRGDEHLLSLTLMWDCPIGENKLDPPAYFNIFRVSHDSNTFLGRAMVEAYRVCQIPVSKTCSSVEFIIQIVTSSGLKKPVRESTHFKLNW